MYFVPMLLTSSATCAQELHAIHQAIMMQHGAATSHCHWQVSELWWVQECTQGRGSKVAAYQLLRGCRRVMMWGLL